MGRIMIALLLMPMVSFTQTAIVAKRTKKAIYVGADSKYGYPQRNEKTGKLDTLYSTACKIRSSGRFHFAFSGMYGFQALAIASDACLRNTRIDSAVNEFSVNFQEFLGNEMVNLKKQSPRSMDETLLNNPSLANMLFFGMHNKKLIAILVQWKVHYDGASFDISVDTGFLPAGKALATGHIEAIEPLIYRDSTWRGNKTKAMERLIKITIQATPKYVGPPIQIVRLTRKGLKWISKSLPCK